MIAPHNHSKAQPTLVALFASDVHLRASLPKTSQAFFAFLKTQVPQAKQLFLLGDLFEYWAGDDDIVDDYNQKIVDALRAVNDTGTEIFWIAGNRDFLIGDLFAEATGAQLLPDPSVITLAGKQIVIAHGDAQCTDDVAYIAFRNQVRQTAWQTQFLNMPLTQRKAIIEGMRKDSKMEQKGKSLAIMDVNQAAIEKLFSESGAKIMIHGHTHRPAIHQHGQTTRYVLPDWDCDVGITELARGGWLALYDNGEFVSYQFDGTRIGTPSEAS